MTESLEAGILGSVRRVLLLILFLGIVGMAVELLFLRHVEELAQLIPLVLLAVGFSVAVWHAVQQGPVSLMALQVVMVLFVAAGLLGIVMHYGANVEFQREMDPSIGGMPLFWKAMSAKTPPPLAPGSMSQLGLIGLAYSYGHPAFTRAPHRSM